MEMEQYKKKWKDKIVKLDPWWHLLLVADGAPGWSIILIAETPTAWDWVADGGPVQEKINQYWHAAKVNLGQVMSGSLTSV